MVSSVVLAVSVAAAAIIAGVGAYYAGTAATINQSELVKEVDPVLGFVGLTPVAPMPVQPDHEVHLVIQPVEGSPIPHFFFEPTGLFIQPGDTVKFTFDTPDHTVTAYHAAHGFAPRVPDGASPFSSPIVPPGGYWLYTFEEEGVYDVYCGPHQIFGMVMRVVVGSATGPGTSPVIVGPPSEEPPFQPFLTAALVLSDPALAPENIISEGSVSWDTVSPESKKLFVQLSES